MKELHRPRKKKEATTKAGKKMENKNGKQRGRDEKGGQVEEREIEDKNDKDECIKFNFFLLDNMVLKNLTIHITEHHKYVYVQRCLQTRFKNLNHHSDIS